MRSNYRGKSCLKLKNHPYNRHSSDKPDQLSYSYSCIEAFKENQNLLNNLINLKPQPKFNVVQEDPVLFSLSGEREYPIYHPFCYSISKSEHIGTGEHCNRTEFEGLYKPKRNSLELEDVDNDLRDENCSEKLYFDSNLLFQWIKYQFKYVNDLWPFLKSKEYFIPNLCKKSKEIKMEMLLNNIDKQSKCSLKRYVEFLQLSLEEKCSIRNESVIEIDITPIIGNKQRLQEFLEFLQNIESASNSQNEKPEDNKPKIPLKSKISIVTTNYKGKGDFTGNDTYLYSPRQQTLKQGLKAQSPSIFKQRMVYKDSNTVENSRNINLNLLRNSEFGSNVETIRRPREVEPSPQNSLIANHMNKSAEKPEVSRNKLKQEQNNTWVCSEQEDILEKTSSCKCLMHQRREDFRRYKDQCLFGKGDERSNNFIGYVHLQENESRPCKCLSDKRFKVRESKNVPIHQKVYGNKCDLRTNDKEKSSGSNVTDVCFHNCESIQADDSEEVICKVDFRESAVDNRTAKGNSVNACFESLNYSFGSVSWTTISDPFADSTTPCTSSTGHPLPTKENLAYRQYLPLNGTRDISKQTQLPIKNAGLNASLNWYENIVRKIHVNEAFYPNKIERNKEKILIKMKENPPSSREIDSRNHTSNRLQKNVYGLEMERSNLEEQESVKRQTDTLPESSKPYKKYSKLNVLKPKHLYKSITGMMKGNNTTKPKTVKEKTDDKTLEQPARVPLTPAQQSEITALIIDNFEKVYEELKKQNSEITNLKKILYDRVYDD